MKKVYRTGTSLAEFAKSATGRAAEQARLVIDWNEDRKRFAKRRGREADVARYDSNIAGLKMALVRIAQAGR